jgi:hypothetical protein
MFLERNQNQVIKDRRAMVRLLTRIQQLTKNSTIHYTQHPRIRVMMNSTTPGPSKLHKFHITFNISVTGRFNTTLLYENAHTPNIPAKPSYFFLSIRSEECPLRFSRDRVGKPQDEF